MYTDEELEKLAKEEDTLTEEAIIAILLVLGVAKSNLESELRNFYFQYGKDGIVTYQEARKWISAKNHTRRLVFLDKLINAIVSDSFDAFEISFKNHLKDIILKESKFFDVVVDIDDILNTPWGKDGLTWSQRLLAHKSKWVATIGNDFKISMLKRESLTDVMKKLGGRFNSMEKILQRLTITESTAIRSLARQQIFITLGIENYRFYTQDDEHTCEECDALHGHIFPMTAYEVGFTASPLHAYCRCWEVPIMD